MWGEFDRCSIALLHITQHEAFHLIGSGGDDGTRTHDPLLANMPDLDGDERWRTTSPDQGKFADDGEAHRTAADVRQMFDRAALQANVGIEQLRRPIPHGVDRPAPQNGADVHGIAPTSADPPVFNFSEPPRISTQPQVPLPWLTTNGSLSSALLARLPPAVQSPGAKQDTVLK